MKNLWHVIILFMLPGLILGGNTVAAFFRLSDGSLEPLAALCAASVVWSASAFLFFAAAALYCKSSHLYYPAMAFSAVLFALLTGSVNFLCGNGTWAALSGVAVSGAASAWIAQSFTAANRKTLDGWIFIAGVISGGVLWGYAGQISRLAWMETLCSYLTILLLVSWAFASPLTCWGHKSRRWVWRLLLIGCAIGGFYLVPVFSPLPAAALTAETTGNLWSRTFTTTNGRCFVLHEKSGQYGYYTPQGRLLMSNHADENLLASAWALLNVQPKEKSTVLLAVPSSSVLPRNLRGAPGIKVRTCYLPLAMNSSRFNWKNRDIMRLMPRYDLLNKYQVPADIVLITALPENQYPVFLHNFLQLLTGNVQYSNGIVAMPSYLLKNPAVFSFMHEKFPYSGILPVPGDLWVFSCKPLDLSLKNISENMQKQLGKYSNATSEMFAILYSSRVWLDSSAKNPELAGLKYGGNKLAGSWWWIAVGIAVIVLWRMFRLFCERRNIMYSCFNALENAFSGMGTFLLCLSLLLVNNGASVLFLAVTAVFFAIFLAKWNITGVWMALAGLAVLLFAMCNPGKSWIELCLIVVMVQAATLTGAVPKALAVDSASERQLLMAVFAGMLLASCFISTVWLFGMPLLLAWSIIFAARVPGIWQYSRIGVYYKK